MIQVVVKDAKLRESVSQGMDAFIKVFVDATLNAIGGTLTNETIQKLNSNQITLLAYSLLQEEIMDGGFVQLVHNGYGPFFFKNPFAKAIKQWGLRELSKLIYDAHSLYVKYGKDIERDCTDEEFMALFEKYPEFDDLDDTFIENEEEWTEMVARYIDEHIDSFATIED